MNNDLREKFMNELTQSGKCPFCGTQIRIIDNKRSMYKGRPVWITHDIFIVETKCPKCKQILTDKKIA
ncbi:MAG: hypothetical protein A2W23_07625 [Planctomycetes bacterium RBG_16_43_13]|nr:MAG: hypothetical protein A2W23_07625 [Planctomycetes bacterium RBG_16_43_13]